MGVTATSTELNYVDGVTSNIQTQLNNKASSTHTHTKSQISDFPTLATVATSGSYTDLSNKPTIPTPPSIATQAEAEAGTDNSKIMTAFTVLKAIVKNSYDSGHSFANNGHQKLSNGLILQWGIIANNATTVSFPAAFSSTCFGVSLAWHLVGRSIGDSHFLGVKTLSTTNFTCYAVSDNQRFWFAVGI